MAVPIVNGLLCTFNQIIVPEIAMDHIDWIVFIRLRCRMYRPKTDTLGRFYCISAWIITIMINENCRVSECLGRDRDLNVNFVIKRLWFIIGLEPSVVFVGVVVVVVCSRLCLSVWTGPACGMPIRNGIPTARAGEWEIWLASSSSSSPSSNSYFA